jgi:hypothetical protein
MLNRIIASITLLFFCAVYVCGADNLFTFAGMGSYLGEGANKKCIEDMTLTEQVEYVLDTFSGGLKNTPDQVIIAQSQGGLRALGYTHKINTDHATYPTTTQGNVKGIITIDSPVLGYSPLLQGKDVLLSKACNGKTRVINGACAAIFGDSPLLFVAGEIIINGLVLSDPVCSGMLISNFHLNQIWIDDLTAQSPFIKDNILPPWIEAQWHWEQVWIVTGWDYQNDCEAGYWESVMVVDVPGYYDLSNTRFNSSLKVGFVVGQLNDPIKALVNSQPEPLGNPRGDVVSAGEFGIRAGIFTLNLLLLIGGAVHTIEAIASLTAAIANFFCLNFLVGLACLAVFAYEGTMAYFCYDAYSITSDIPGWFGSVLGSSANDSFVLESDQTCDLALLGASPADPYYNIRKVSTANHQTSNYHPEIWGDVWDNYTWYRLDKANVCSRSILDTFLGNIGPEVPRSGVFVQ